MTRSRLARAAGVAVALLLGAELLARALGPYLPAPDLYADASTAVKAAQLDRLAGTDRCAAVVLAGNSMSRDDLVPSAIGDGLEPGVLTYNAALDAASPQQLGAWVANEVIPALDPDLVVIGLSSFDLNDRARLPAAALESYSAAPLTRTDFFGRLGRPFVDHSALFRHRQELRNPVTAWNGLSAAVNGDRAEQPSSSGLPGLIDGDGAGLSRRMLEYVASDAATVALQQDLLNDFVIGPEQRGALTQLVEDLTAGGRSVALVALPVTRQFIDAHPQGASDYDEFLATAGDIANETDAAFVDLHAWADASDFADTHHLAGAAADRLSAELPDILQDAGVVLPRC